MSYLFIYEKKKQQHIEEVTTCPYLHPYHISGIDVKGNDALR
ncbi:MAG: hypothetical protein OXC62_14055 [Aestuariivita sp.]|nr:hypothetical protein [Aestuariivita sp.]